MTGKIIVIVGPTGSGKTGLAVKIGKKFGGEIISADSRQIYRGLKIGSNYPSDKELKSVPHHLIGFVDPKNNFTVAEYQKKAFHIINILKKKNKIPIICGGTGFYVRSITDGTVMPTVPPDEKLRNNLENKTIESLDEILKNLDKKRWGNIDLKNKRRVIRAIEIASVLGRVPDIEHRPPKENILKIGIDIPKNKLKKSIETRAKSMLRSGLIKETKKLVSSGIGIKKINELGFEYKDVLRYINGEIKTKAELIDLLVLDTMHYVKRQITWFKKDKNIHWVMSDTEAKKIIDRFLSDTL
ncbi:tRNA (adenosine(37)-N6)-dimethylallyltransferase MiaA [Patescibacteria group bacterium]|nr:tRNA (adenosine(37)-N6)-dimethylallyltransferase MiaA [Patescibacteria group bacterium]